MGVEGTKPKFGFKMPKIGFGGKKDVSGDIDVKADLPSADIDVSGDADMPGGADLSRGIDVEGTKPKFGFKMPKIGFGGKKDVSGDIDVNTDLPSENIDVSGDADMSGGADLSGGISAEGSADIDVEGTKPKFGFKMPKIGFGGGKDAKVSIEGPSVDVTGEADVS